MSKMKLFKYRTIYGIDFLAIIKNGYVIDIACSGIRPVREPGCANHWEGSMYSEKDRREYIQASSLGSITLTKRKNIKKAQVKVRARDLALYTHWPQHTKEFWDLLNET